MIQEMAVTRGEQTYYIVVTDEDKILLFEEALELWNYYLQLKPKPNRIRVYKKFPDIEIFRDFAKKHSVLSKIPRNAWEQLFLQIEFEHSVS